MLPVSRRLLRLLSAAGMILGMTVTQAAAAERIRHSFSSEAEVSSWFEAAGNWTVRNGRYIGRPGKDPSAIAIYSDNNGGGLSDYRGSVILTVPTDGAAFVLVRAKSRPLPGGEDVVTGYSLGLLNRLGNTHLRVVRRDADGETTVLCNKLVRPSPTGFQSLKILVSGSVLQVNNSGKECRAFDRVFGDGRFGLETRGGSKTSLFRVELVDVSAK